MPPSFWRTAREATEIQPSNNDAPIAVCPGDIATLEVKSVMAALRKEGSSRVDPVFGGVRQAGGTSPVHACPGYEAAMGVIEGVLGALLEGGPWQRPESGSTLAFYAD